MKIIRPVLAIVFIISSFTDAMQGYFYIAPPSFSLLTGFPLDYGYRIVMLSDAEEMPVEEIGEKALRRACIKNAGIPTPEGFVITTSCLKQGLSDKDLSRYIRKIEKRTEKKLGDPENPLLISVNSSADEPYSGLLTSVLYVGFTEAVYRQLKETLGDKTASAMYAAFLKSFGVGVYKIARSVFYRIEQNTGNKAEQVEQFKALYHKEGRNIPLSAKEQLLLAIQAVHQSGNNSTIFNYLASHGRQGPADVAVIVSEMVNTVSDDGIIGVLYTHNPQTALYEPHGSYLPEASGDDLQGFYTPLSFDRLEQKNSFAYGKIIEYADTILKMNNGLGHRVEFAVKGDNIYILQVQPQSFPAWAVANTRQSMDDFISKDHPRLPGQKRLIVSSPKSDVYDWTNTEWADILILGKKRNNCFSYASFAVGYLVFSLDSAKQYLEQNKSIIYTSNGNDYEEIIELLTANRLTGLILPQHMVICPHMKELIEHFQIPVARVSQEDAVSIEKNSIIQNEPEKRFFKEGDMLSIECRNDRIYTDTLVVNYIPGGWEKVSFNYVPGGFNYYNFRKTIEEKYRDEDLTTIIKEHNLNLAGYWNFSSKLRRFMLLANKNIDNDPELINQIKVLGGIVVETGLTANILFNLIIEKAKVLNIPEQEIQLSLVMGSTFCESIPGLEHTGYKLLNLENCDRFFLGNLLACEEELQGKHMIVFWEKDWTFSHNEPKKYFTNVEWKKYGFEKGLWEPPFHIHMGYSSQYPYKGNPYRAYIVKLLQKAEDKKDDMKKFIDYASSAKNVSYMNPQTIWRDHTHDFSTLTFGILITGIIVPDEKLQETLHLLARYHKENEQTQATHSVLLTQANVRSVCTCQ